MASRTPTETLHDIKRHLDNGFNGKQIAEKLNVSEGIISKLRLGHYGSMPKNPYDDELRAELRRINLVKLNNKIRGRV